METNNSGYSLTQGSNLMTIATAISLIVSHADFSKPENVQIVLTAIVLIVTGITSFYGRYRAGGVTLLGKKK